MVLLEVETKIKLENSEVSELRRKIKKIAKFDKKEKRVDDYFALHKKYRKHDYPKKAFRIRHNGKKYVINFKKWLTEYWDKYIVVKEEFEFETEHPEEFLALMKDLGFVQWMKKFKTSESYKYKKDKRIIIEMNYVRHLGYFIEMEYICKKAEMKKAKLKIRKVIDELGIKQKQIHNTGYTKMLWDKGKKGRKYWVD